MSISKRELLAASLALGFSAVGATTYAFAQAPNPPAHMIDEMGEDDVIYYNAATGKMIKAPVKFTPGRGLHAKALAAGAKEVPKGTRLTKTSMVYRRGGKYYMLENRAGTVAGKTIIQENFQDVFGGTHEY